jgi:hypothetical protein
MLDQERRRQMFKMGFQFRASGVCKVHGCKAMVEYWQRGKEVSIRDYIGFSPHWVTCAGRSKKKTGTAASQLEMFPAGK